MTQVFKRVGAVASLAVIIVALAMAQSVKQPDAGTALASCDPEAQGLPEDAPGELVAFFDDDCAAALVARDRPLAAGRAIALSSPALLIANTPPSQAIPLLSDLVSQGERGFFAKHPESVATLRSFARSGERDRVVAYLSALFTPQDGPPNREVAAFWAQSLPVHDAASGVAALLSYCADGACDDAPTVCPGDLGLADKLRFVKGEMDFGGIVALCAPSPQWIMALRRAGVVDTRCSAPFQVNRVMERPETLFQDCAVSVESFADHVAFGYGATEVVALLRTADLQEAVALLPMAAFDILGDSFPEAAAYLSRLKQGEQ